MARPDLILFATAGDNAVDSFKNLISAQVRAGPVGPVLQSCVSQFQGGRLGLEICIQPADVALHPCHFIFGLQADVQNRQGHYQETKKTVHCSWEDTMSSWSSYFSYLPLQLTARLLFVMSALAKSKLRGPRLGVQLVLQL